MKVLSAYEDSHPLENERLDNSQLIVSFKSSTVSRIFLRGGKFLLLRVFCLPYFKFLRVCALGSYVNKSYFRITLVISLKLKAVLDCFTDPYPHFLFCYCIFLVNSCSIFESSSFKISCKIFTLHFGSFQNKSVHFLPYICIPLSNLYSW